MKRRENAPSRSGFHFMDAYQQCRRKFFLQYPMRLVPAFTAPPLTFGRWFHAAQAEWYETGKESRAVAVFEDGMRSAQDEYENPLEYSTHMTKGPILFRAWLNTHGRQDLKLYKVIGVEHEMKAKLPNGFEVTGRADVILQDRNGMVFIKDTKTSSSSVTMTRISGELSDQGTTYCWLWLKTAPKKMKKFGGFMLDIAYWNENSTRASNIILYRSDLILPSKFWLHAFELYTMDVMTEIAQRVEAVRQGTHNPVQAFPPTTSACFSYHSVCPYIEVCRRDIRTTKDGTGFGFNVERTDDLDALSRMNLRFDSRKYGLTKEKLDDSGFKKPKKEVEVTPPSIDMQDIVRPKEERGVKRTRKGAQVKGLSGTKARRR